MPLLSSNEPGPLSVGITEAESPGRLENSGKFPNLEKHSMWFFSGAYN